jgi:hypothetical protein
MSCQCRRPNLTALWGKPTGDLLLRDVIISDWVSPLCVVGPQRERLEHRWYFTLKIIDAAVSVYVRKIFTTE